jgi:hypothetical protein
LEKRRLYIHRVISVLLLWVFAIALTPFGVFHHHDHHTHEHTCSLNSKNCGHKLHVTTQTDHCLICEAHFEKNYTTSKAYFRIYLISKPVQKFYGEVSNSYTRLINLALRGPPVV